MRREIARIALEKLIQDGRIHPARIEEMVEKAKREVDAHHQAARANGPSWRPASTASIPELVKLLGRHALPHQLRPERAEPLHRGQPTSPALLAAELGADVTMAKRAGLLHDIGKAVDHEIEGSHVQIGVDLARKYKESAEVIHAIEAHHNDVEPQTVVACLVQAADAISAARPGARRENVENYIKRLEKLEEIANELRRRG